MRTESIFPDMEKPSIPELSELRLAYEWCREHKAPGSIVAAVALAEYDLTVMIKVLFTTAQARELAARG